MQTPFYSGTPSGSTPPASPKSRLQAMALFGINPPPYTGSPGGGTGQGGSQGAPKLIKTVTFTVLSPQLSSGILPAAAPAAAESSSSSKHPKASAAIVGGNEPGPVAKSQPVVIAVPDGAKSYEIRAGSLAYPALSASGVIPPIPSAMPVGIDQPPKGDLDESDAQVQVTVSWMLLPGAVNANAGDYKTLLTVEFYG